MPTKKNTAEKLPEPAEAGIGHNNPPVLTIAEYKEMSGSKIYTDNLIPGIVAAAEAEALKVPVDMTTEKGRDAIRSAAFAVSTTKTFFDGMGTALTEEWRKQTTAVNDKRKVLATQMDALRDKVRKPLTDWEAADATRKSEHTAAFQRMKAVSTLWGYPTTDQVRDAIEKMAEFKDRKWEEFAEQGTAEYDKAMQTLENQLAVAIKAEEDAKELQRLKQAETDRLAAEEAAKPKPVATPAPAAPVKVASVAAPLPDPAIAAAAEQKIRDDAAQKERDRIAGEQEAERQAAATREANTKHKKKINNEAVDDLMKACPALKKADVILLVTAIAKGEVRNVKISY